MTATVEARGAVGDDSVAPLMRELYSALRDIARRERLRANRPRTLQTTALINEAYLKLAGHPAWTSKEHFLGTAARAMRHILVDDARARLARKRGGGVAAIGDAHEDVPEAVDDEVIRIGDALEALRSVDERLAKVVECRFFAGYNDYETARILGVSDRTVRRDWLSARAWLHHALSSSAAV